MKKVKKVTKAAKITATKKRTGKSKTVAHWHEFEHDFIIIVGGSAVVLVLSLLLFFQ